MELRITDLLEGLQESSIQLETKKYARPEQVLRLSRELIKAEQKRRRRAGRGKQLLTALLVLALLAGLGGGIYYLRQRTVPADEPQETLEPEETPPPEPEEVDEERSEALIGGYVSAVGEYATLGDYMLTVREAVLDDNGVGILRLQVKNALGHGFVPTAEGDFVQEKEPYLSCQVSSSLGKRLRLETQGIYEERSDTAMDFVYTLAPEEPLNWTEDVLLQFTLSWPSTGESETGRITLPAASRVPAQRFYEDGLLVSCSPVGLMLCFTTTVRDSLIGDPAASWEERFETERLELHFFDGSVYTVLGEGIDHSACVAQRDQRTWIAFDRLVDTDQLTELLVTGEHIIRIAGNSKPTVSRYSYVVTSNTVFR